ncbi:SDR family NAD(P)-dependent oxidoreductase [Gaoshiqia sp. Z1-71]|uniref:SDR family NAD(P)-dependent oxidoreductase n=1 Tax=Gaoshiqia hydrogeniformans TaxID=3290090 RepID=UPI003BF8BFC0
MKDVQQLYTVITGASQGLGKEFARECARRNMNLILISLPDEDLEIFGTELKETYRIQVHAHETDLTSRESIEELAAWITNNFSVNILINNAGTGGSCMFDACSIDYLDNMIQLNVRAVTLITRLLLPELNKHADAYILNVSSLAAFSPVPFKTIYPASKVFIHHFTLGLRAELKNTNIKVSVLNPGPIKTNSDVTNRINGQSYYVKLSTLTPEVVARIGIKQLLRGKSLIIPGFWNQFNAFVIRLSPLSFRINIGTSIFRRDFHEKNRPAEINGISKNGLPNNNENEVLQQAGRPE